MVSVIAHFGQACRKYIKISNNFSNMTHHHDNNSDEQYHKDNRIKTNMLPWICPFWFPCGYIYIYVSLGFLSLLPPYFLRDFFSNTSMSFFSNISSSSSSIILVCLCVQFMLLHFTTSWLPFSCSYLTLVASFSQQTNSNFFLCLCLMLLLSQIDYNVSVLVLVCVWGCCFPHKLTTTFLFFGFDLGCFSDN